ncbi:MAG: response regulator [Acidobacteriota bacterium]
MPTTLKKKAMTASDNHGLAPACFGSDKMVSVLAVSPLEEDHVFLRHIFSHSNWVIHSARSCTEAFGFLDARATPVVVCERNLPDGTWQELLIALERMRPPPLLIVTSRAADDFLWAEVLNLGGYDVLVKPFDPSEVVRVVSLAWLHWKNQRDRAGGSRQVAPAQPRISGSGIR